MLLWHDHMLTIHTRADTVSWQCNVHVSLTCRHLALAHLSFCSFPFLRTFVAVLFVSDHQHLFNIDHRVQLDC